MTELIHRPGLEGVVAGDTAISTIAGGLTYRGYDVVELAARATFEETAYLLLYGELPTARELWSFCGRLHDAAQVPPEVLEGIRRAPAGAPLMDILRSGASLLAHHDPDVGDNRREANLRKAERLLAQLPIVLADRWRSEQGAKLPEFNPQLSLAANILWLLHGHEPTPEQARAIDLSLILYAEHEFNASTFTARVVAATLSDLHSAVVAAIGALKGPLHGGANERVLEVLQQVGSADRAAAWIRDALARKQRIMGFGHRVYKTGDPRAVLLKPLCQQLAAATGHDDLEARAEVIEQIVVAEKGLPPNLDWPSARLYYYLGLAVPLYTPLFVLSRVAGWSAHVIEQHENNRLIRPRSHYTGPAPRAFTPLEAR